MELGGGGGEEDFGGVGGREAIIIIYYMKQISSVKKSFIYVYIILKITYIFEICVCAFQYMY